MLDLILQLAILTIGAGYFVGLLAVLLMEKKSFVEKLGYAAILTLIASIIGFILIAALFGQGQYG